MAIRIRKHGSVIASFATPAAVDISHLSDSIMIGDGTNIMGPLQNNGGVQCIPVDLVDGTSTLATTANQTNGTQKTQIVDAGNVVAEIDDVAGEKAIKVSVIASVGGGSAPSETDGGTFTAGASVFTPIGAQYDSNGSDDLADTKMGTLRCTAERSLNVNLAEGTSTLATAANQTTIIGHVDGLETLITSTNTKLDTVIGHVDGVEGILTTIDADTGSIMTAVQLIDDAIFADDAGFTAATSKVMVIGGQYQSSPNTLDDNDAGSILLDTNHAVQVVLRAGTAAFGKLAANNGVDIGDVDVTSVTAAAATNKCDIGLINAVTPLMGTGNTGTGSLRVTIATDQTSLTNPLSVGGPVAVDAAASGNPLITGAVARLTDLPAAQADTAGDVVRILADKFGRLLIGGACAPGATKYQTTTITASASETTVITAAGSEIHDIIMLVLTNTSATDCLVSLKDSTGGTTRMTFLVPKGGGIVMQPCSPMAQLAAANNNWTVTGTSVSSLYVNAMFLVRPS